MKARTITIIKKLSKIVFICLLVLGLYIAFTHTLIGVNKQEIAYYTALKSQIKAKGYAPNFWIISTIRPKFFNDFLVYINNGAARKSRHITGDAIDLVVLDVNQDGKTDKEDVRIVKNILAEDIIQNKGGIGTYTSESNFFSRQMVHFDCRGNGARWER